MNNKGADQEKVNFISRRQRAFNITQQTELTSCMLEFFHHSFFSVDFFQFSKRILSVSNGLNADHARYSVGPDLDQNCLQRKVVAQ